MTRGSNRSRLNTIEATALRSGIGEAVGHAPAFEARLTHMAAHIVEGGCAWHSYEPAVLAAAHAELVATAVAGVADEEARAEAVLNGAPPVPWEQTPKQRAASIESLTHRVSGSRLHLKLLTAVGRTIADDDPNRIATQPGAHVQPPSAMSAAEFVALAMTAHINTGQPE